MVGITRSKVIYSVSTIFHVLAGCDAQTNRQMDGWMEGWDGMGWMGWMDGKASLNAQNVWAKHPHVNNANTVAKAVNSLPRHKQNKAADHNRDVRSLFDDDLVTCWSVYCCFSMFLHLESMMVIESMSLIFESQVSNSEHEVLTLQTPKKTGNWWSGWWFEPLWKILVSWDDYSQYMEK